MELSPVVFLLDVDNTLLDNDRVIEDLKDHLMQAFGVPALGDCAAVLLRTQLVLVGHRLSSGALLFDNFCFFSIQSGPQACHSLLRVSGLEVCASDVDLDVSPANEVHIVVRERQPVYGHRLLEHRGR